ncbi:hypothetical protein QCF19_14330, partial [Staphylococcus aureus]|nr:hypothetical protein [Staphylococcus aureus]
CHAAALIATLVDAGCTVRGDDAVREIVPGLEAATPEDWDTEYLDAIASVALVDGVEAAMAHIAAHGSHHTDAILAEDEAVAERFLAEVNAHPDQLAQNVRAPAANGAVVPASAPAQAAGIAGASAAAAAPATPSAADMTAALNTESPNAKRYADASPTNVEDAYNALKTYLMLADKR